MIRLFKKIEVRPIEIHLDGTLDLTDPMTLVNIDRLKTDTVLKSLLNEMMRIWYIDLNNLDPLGGTEEDKLKFRSARSKIEGVQQLRELLNNIDTKLKVSKEGEKDIYG